MPLPALHGRLEWDGSDAKYTVDGKSMILNKETALAVLDGQLAAGKILAGRAETLRAKLDPQSGAGVAAVQSSFVRTAPVQTAPVVAPVSSVHGAPVVLPNLSAAATAMAEAAKLRGHLTNAAGQFSSAIDGALAMARSAPDADDLVAGFSASNQRMIDRLAGKKTTAPVAVGPSSSANTDTISMSAAAVSRAADLEATQPVKKSDLAVAHVAGDLRDQPAATAWLNTSASRAAQFGARSARGEENIGSFNAVFVGVNGVGQTLAADIYARQLFEQGVTSSPERTTIDLRRVLEEDKSKLSALLLEVKAGVLVIANADALTEQHREELLLIEHMLAEGEPVIILSGEPTLERTTRSAWQLQSVKSFVKFDELKPKLLADLFLESAIAKGYLDPNDAANLQSVKNAAIGRMRQSGANNTNAVTDLLEEVVRRMAERVYPKGEEKTGEVKSITIGDIQRFLPVDENGRAIALQPMDKLEGQEAAKNRMELMTKTVIRNAVKEARGEETTPILRNLMFMANQGVGKTTFADIARQILVDSGIRNDRYMSITAGDLNSGRYTARQLYDIARGGVIFVDEWHQLKPEIIAQLVPLALNHGLETSLFGAGYPGPVKDSFKDPGLAGRFPEATSRIELNDQSPAELKKIFLKTVAKIGASADQVAVDAAMRNLELQKRGADFQNARAAVQLAETALEAAGGRDDIGDGIIALVPADFGEQPMTTEELLQQRLSKYPNFASVMEELSDLALRIENRRKQGKPIGNTFDSNAFIVAPRGAGGEELANELSPIYRSFGVIGNAKPKPVNAVARKGGFVGHAETNTTADLKDAIGGQIVYKNLAQCAIGDDQFSQNLIMALTSELESPEFKGRMAVTAVVTPEELAVLEERAPALVELFTKRYEVPGLDAEGSAIVLEQFVNGQDYTFAPDAKKALVELMSGVVALHNFSNRIDLETLSRGIETSFLRDSKGKDESDNVVSLAVLKDAVGRFLVKKDPSLALTGLPIAQNAKADAAPKKVKKS